MKISVIGAGNMGGALLRGWLSKGVSPSSVIVTNPHPEKLAPFGEKGASTSCDNALALEGDVIILAVKPWIVGKVASEISPLLPKGKAIVSLAASVDGKALREMFPTCEDLFIAIPNTAVELGEGVTFLSAVTSADEKVKKEVFDLFQSLGICSIVEEKNLPAGMALASCGIAYAMRYVRASVEGGVELGIRASEATRIVAQTLRGAASLLLENSSHPEAEIDKVTTPGGLTIKGLNAMEEAGFTSSVIKGLKACVGK